VSSPRAQALISATTTTTTLWVLGSGPVIATVTTSGFEVFRCLGGRRSERQIGALEWGGDLDAVLPFVSPYPLPMTDIVEA